VITAKDLLRLRREQEQGRGLAAVMRPPLLAPESRPITDLLHDFRRRRGHLALVVDEFGDVSGLVTVEDVLEEIFGQFNEADDEPELVSLGDNHWKVVGGIEVADFNTVTGANLPALPGSTIGGLVLARLGRRPRQGDVVAIGAFTFSVLEVHGIIIHRLEVKRGPEP
jgi:magnesium and cobalt transporter